MVERREYNHSVITSGVAMQSKIVAIGNSSGVRIPKKILEKYHFAEGQPVELEALRDGIRIRPLKLPREGWEAAAKKMAADDEDKNPWGELPPTIDSDDEEWTW